MEGRRTAAQAIYKILINEKLYYNENDNTFMAALQTVEDMVLDFRKGKSFEENLPYHVAVTLLGINHVFYTPYRFILEYLIKYKNDTISLMWLGNDIYSVHLIYIGPLHIKQGPLSFEKFLSSHKEGVVVDPNTLPHFCAGNTPEELREFIQFCRKRLQLVFPIYPLLRP
jgi:hypothetical protein